MNRRANGWGHRGRCATSNLDHNQTAVDKPSGSRHRASALDQLFNIFTMPIFWNLADLVMRPHPDGITLGGMVVSRLEQADDIVVFSTSPLAVQY